ncbi:hypothetical protein NDU88_004309 [Pleurodeles waltl]|uniref:Uncharacterized protein n=1 Tax=Pleurodeles waltl TaxID=8319 RepID=A0AAV7NTC8_PLEWA|nr:hypothetical protein NDU88_004309 [Pleurodeles waltl]
MTGRERAHSAGAMNMDRGAASKVIKDGIQVAKERWSFTSWGVGKTKEVMGARGPSGMGSDWGKSVPTKEYAGGAPVCEADGMELDYFEDSPEVGEIIDCDSDTEGGQVEVQGGSVNVPCPSVLQCKEKHRQTATERTVTRTWQGGRLWCGCRP